MIHFPHYLKTAEVGSGIINHDIGDNEFPYSYYIIRQLAVSNILFVVFVQPFGCYHLVSPGVAADYVGKWGKCDKVL